MSEAQIIKQLLIKNQIVETVLRFALAFDLQNWPMLRNCLADQVFVDYSDFRGDEPKFILADEYVSARENNLRGLKTQHMSTNHLVAVENDRAECTSAFLIHRIDPNLPPERNFLDTAGHYSHGLGRLAEDVWVIQSIRQTVVWNRGNPQIHRAFR